MPVPLMNPPFIRNAVLASGLALILSACTFPSAANTLEPGTATQAAGTVGAILTLVGDRGTPTSEAPLAPSPAVSPTFPSQPTSEAPQPAACSDRATFVDDVTIRDNSPLTPGEAFVKIWRLQNSGTCTWTQAYALVFFGGDRMEAPTTLPLAGNVPPASTVDLVVDMTAPGAPGTYQGFWRLRNGAGLHFGIGPTGDQSFWVKIVVLPSLTPTVTATPSPTVSATPIVLASGSLELAPGSSVDLDSGTTNPASGADLVFTESTPAADALVPQNGALLALYSPPSPPGPIECLAAPLSAGAVPTSLLAPGSLACYRTDQARRGYLMVTSLGETLTLTFTTWIP